MNIRMALDGNAAAVRALARELALHVADPDPGLDSPEWLELGFGEDKWFDCLVAEIDSEIVGFALYCRRFEAHTRSRALRPVDLVVAAPNRRRGIGRSLLGALRRKAAELGCDGIVLELWTGNSTASGFYQKLGARRSAELEIHVIPTTSE